MGNGQLFSVLFRNFQNGTYFVECVSTTNNCIFSDKLLFLYKLHYSEEKWFHLLPEWYSIQNKASILVVYPCKWVDPMPHHHLCRYRENANCFFAKLVLL